jgi:UDP-N-acetylmuramate dehydrogenase
VQDLSIKAISDAVVKIRQSKLPDPKEIGNSGSFFKNPIISATQFNALHEQFPDVPNYPATESSRKIAAGWLIEKAGWKGKKIDNYGVHDKQALVLVNHGGAKGQDILQLSTDIINSVDELFGVRLEREVNVI